MKKIGIIMEVNPFHNGHKYFIDTIKKMYKDSCLIAITSTSFNMRGQIAVINKFDKTEYLLKSGVNLVLELPIGLYLQSGDFFSENAVNILQAFNIDEIICGSETDDKSLFPYFYNLINSDEFKKIIKEQISNHSSYKNSFTKAFESLNISQELIDIFNEPNFTLAFQYYKTIQDKNLPIAFKIIKRNNIDNSSATELRKAIENNQIINNELPFDEQIINIKDAENKLFNILKYRFTLGIDNDSLDIEVLNYLNHNNLVIDSTKNFTISRLRRAYLAYIIGMKKYYHNVDYYRILGIDDIGKYIIKNLDKETKKLIFSSPLDKIDDEIKNQLELELRSTKLFEILTGNNIMEKEYKLPIIKENLI